MLVIKVAAYSVKITFSCLPVVVAPDQSVVANRVEESSSNCVFSPAGSVRTTEPRRSFL